MLVRHLGYEMTTDWQPEDVDWRALCASVDPSDEVAVALKETLEYYHELSNGSSAQPLASEDARYDTPNDFPSAVVSGVDDAADAKSDDEDSDTIASSRSVAEAATEFEELTTAVSGVPASGGAHAKEEVVDDLWWSDNEEVEPTSTEAIVMQKTPGKRRQSKRLAAQGSLGALWASFGTNTPK